MPSKRPAVAQKSPSVVTLQFPSHSHPTSFLAPSSHHTRDTPPRALYPKIPTATPTDPATSSSYHNISTVSSVFVRLARQGHAKIRYSDSAEICDSFSLASCTTFNASSKSSAYTRAYGVTLEGTEFGSTPASSKYRTLATCPLRNPNNGFLHVLV